MRGNLEAFLAGGGRKIDAWYAALKVVEVRFDDEADAFRNINTLEELDRRMTASRRPSAASTATTRRAARRQGARGDPRLHRADRRRPKCLGPRSALGRVLAQDIVPTINVPAHDNSAMDGYAVRFADLRSEPLCTRSAPRSPASRSTATWAPGECVRIMTGAVMPPGADTVVIQEVRQARRRRASSSRRARSGRRTCATPAKT